MGVANLRNWLFALVALLFVAPLQAAPTGLVTDISNHQIAISSNFRGTSLLLFGAIDWSRVPIPKSEKIQRDVASWRDRPFDVIIVVQGPAQDYVLRKKTEIGGVWVNTEAAKIRKLPSFYALASTRDPKEILLPEELKRYPLGLSHLQFDWGKPLVPEKAEEYREAVIREKVQNGVYSERPTSLQVLDDTLFRTEIHFPANVPVGRYRADIYLIRNGMVLTHQSAPISVDKIGLERAIHEFANTRPAIYGVLCVVLAVTAGLVAGALSRRFAS